MYTTQQLPPEFKQRVGYNTDYLFHNEEIMAENFALLLTQELNDLVSPQICIGLDQLLRQ